MLHFIGKYIQLHVHCFAGGFINEWRRSFRGGFNEIPEAVPLQDFQDISQSLRSVTERMIFYEDIAHAG